MNEDKRILSFMQLQTTGPGPIPDGKFSSRHRKLTTITWRKNLRKHNISSHQDDDPEG